MTKTSYQLAHSDDTVFASELSPAQAAWLATAGIAFRVVWSGVRPHWIFAKGDHHVDVQFYCWADVGREHERCNRPCKVKYNVRHDHPAGGTFQNNHATIKDALRVLAESSGRADDLPWTDWRPSHFVP